MPKKKLRKRNGFILLIVITSLVIMSIVVLGILSRNVSRSLVLNDRVHNIQAGLIARGAMWRGLDVLKSGGTLNNYSEYIDNILYNVTYTTSAGIWGTTRISVDVSY